MRTRIGRVHRHRRQAGALRKAATTWCSTVGGLVTLALLLVPLAAAAQRPRTLPRIAYLSLAPGPLADRSEAFVQGLRELGYVEGEHLLMEYRWSAGDVERLRAHAAELVRLGVHVIVTGGPLATRAAKDLTRTLPIVMAADIDAVGDGFVASLGRPGGNITGMTALSPELSGKRLELLKATVPGLARVAVLWNPMEVSAARQLQDTEDAARGLGLQVHALEVRGPDDFAGAFAAALQGGLGASPSWPILSPCFTEPGLSTSRHRVGCRRCTGTECLSKPAVSCPMLRVIVPCTGAPRTMWIAS